MRYLLFAFPFFVIFNILHCRYQYISTSFPLDAEAQVFTSFSPITLTSSQCGGQPVHGVERWRVNGSVHLTVQDLEKINPKVRINIISTQVIIWFIFLLIFDLTLSFKWTKNSDVYQICLCIWFRYGAISTIIKLLDYVCVFVPNRLENHLMKLDILWHTVSLGFWK